MKDKLEVAARLKPRISNVDGVGSAVRKPAGIGTSAHLSETTLAPRSAPGVLDKPVVLTSNRISTESNHK